MNLLELIRLYMHECETVGCIRAYHTLVVICGESMTQHIVACFDENGNAQDCMGGRLEVSIERPTSKLSPA